MGILLVARMAIGSTCLLAARARGRREKRVLRAALLEAGVKPREAAARCLNRN